MISKNKIMLQIPVEKQMAKDFKDLAKKTGVSQGELFTFCFALTITMIKGGQKDGKEKN